jgi:hypothetical protein
MEKRLRISDLDFVFISYNEPNKEHNWADLLDKVPWAKRVDGVKGFDSAHKAAAELAETEFFISVDGDNIIDDKFLLETLDFDKTNPMAVHRWRAMNSVNGLVYGNGGIVGWPKVTCLAMKTHENADSELNQIDFCWGVPHENLHNIYSQTIINHSPQQAFTAGFREGVKMSLDRGKVISPSEFMRKIDRSNLNCLLTWMSIGADVEYGKYAILGARMGCWFTTVKGIDLSTIRDIDLLQDKYFKSISDVDEMLLTYGNSLRQRMKMPIADMDIEQSKFFKFCQNKWNNKGIQDREQKSI